MALVSVANLTFGFSERRVLDGVNLTLNEGEHVGMVGVNGCGKSTLMKILAGLDGLKPDAGAVQLARGATVGYLTQDPQLDPDLTLRQEAARGFEKLHRLHDKLNALTHEMASAQGDKLDRLLKRYENLERQLDAAGGFVVDHRIDATLHGVGLGDETFSVKVTDLSGGQKGRLALAKLLLNQPDVLLLDEPTNHLDITGRQWLEQYLAAYRGAVIVVSHDRWLLDRVAHKIVELQQGRIEEYPGNYVQYREQRVQRRLTQQRVYEKQREHVQREQAYIDRYRAGQRARQAKGREKRLERYVSNELTAPPVELDEININLGVATRSGDLVVVAEDIAKAYDKKRLFDAVSLVIKRGDRVGVIGPNGAGKTTLVNCLLGAMEPDRGRVRVGSGVQVGHYRQTHEHLDLSITVVEYLQRHVPDGTDQQARDLAGAFLFSGQDQDKPLSVLSGGERSRVVLAGLVVAGHNLLVLDEPTNHLDIPSAERLEGALGKFTAPLTGWGTKTSGGGTLILITHDRMLLDSLVNQLVVLDGHGRVTHFHGTYSEYLAAQTTPQANAPAPDAAPSKSAPKSPPPAPQKKKPAGRGSAVSKLSQAALEKSIVDIETELAAVDRELADPDTYREGEKVRQLQARRSTLADELTPLEEEWARRADT